MLKRTTCGSIGKPGYSHLAYKELIIQIDWCIYTVSLVSEECNVQYCRIWNICSVKCEVFSISAYLYVAIISLFGSFFSDRLLLKITIFCCKMFTVGSDSQNSENIITTIILYSTV